MASQTKKEKITKSTGNVFRDLGFDNADEMLAKADLVIEIARAMRQKKMTQASLAKFLATDQPAVSKLLRGRTAGYTTDRLMKILNKLGQDVEIKVRKTAKSREFGRVLVLSSAALAAKPAVRKPAAKKVASRKAAAKKSRLRKKKSTRTNRRKLVPA